MHELKRHIGVSYFIKIFTTLNLEWDRGHPEKGKGNLNTLLQSFRVVSVEVLQLVLLPSSLVRIYQIFTCC